MASNILLMTSTIAPASSASMLAVRDAKVRLAQYETALAHNARMLRQGAFDRIVYADNSGHPLDSVEALAAREGIADRTEFLSCKSEPAPYVSRYFLEIGLIDWALNASRFLNAGDDDIVWKVTGRYIVRNLGEIVRAAPRGFDLYLNMRNFPQRALDFYLVAFPRRTYPAHLGRDHEDYRTIRTGETILRDKLESGAFGDIRVVPRLTRTPRLAGVRGFDGARYGGTADTAKFVLRAAANRLAPQIWI